jgi:hypothetical protein
MDGAEVKHSAASGAKHSAASGVGGHDTRLTTHVFESGSNLFVRVLYRLPTTVYRPFRSAQPYCFYYSCSPYRTVSESV